MKNYLKQIIRKDCYKHKINDEDEINTRQNDVISKYEKHEYSFSNAIMYQLFTQGKRKREIAVFPEFSTEFYIVKALNHILKQKTRINYNNRNSVLSGLFDTLKTISKFQDYTIVRFDFKNYFDSLSNQYVYETALLNVDLPRDILDILDEYTSEIRHCKAGLPLSNLFAEIVGQLFDEEVKRLLGGIVFYARYVDDGIIVLNKVLSRDDCIRLLDTATSNIFKNGTCNSNSTHIDFTRKFVCINKQQLPQSFDYLGYSINLISDVENTKIVLGIAEGKRKKFANKTKSVIQKYHGDVEKLRIILLLLSKRVVYTLRKDNDVIKWISKGIVYNYNDLNYFGEIDAKTMYFLNSIYCRCFSELKINVPYYLRGKTSKKRYNLLSNLLENKAFILDEKIGMHKEDLVKLIGKVDHSFNTQNKSYHELTKELLIQCKIGY